MNVLAALALAMSLIVAPQTRAIQWASPEQNQAWNHPAMGPMLMSGGWGSGKTFLGCLRGIYLSTEFPRNRGVIIREVGKELRATTMATFYKVCPPHLYDRRFGGRRSDQAGYLKFRDGIDSEILFIHLDDPNAAGIIRGLEINWFLWDQAEENPEGGEELFDLLLGRLGRWDVAEVSPSVIAAHELEHGERWPYLHPEKGTPVPPSYPMLACNPDVETHWLYQRFHPESHEWQTIYKPRGYRFYDMPSETNRFLGQTNIEFLLQHDDAFVRRNVKGIWGMPEGAIHYLDKLSVIPGSPEVLSWLRARCLLFRTMDYGDSSPTACLWWAHDDAGNLFAYREYYLPNAMISTHRQNLYDLSREEHYELNDADPSIFHKMPKREGGHWTIADEWLNQVEYPPQTSIVWRPADNNELATRNRINEYLRVDPFRVHPLYQTLGSPRLFFLAPNEAYPQGVFHAVRELRNQRRVRVGTHLGKPVFSDERDPTIPDHGYDCVRYKLASMPAVPLPAEGALYGTFFGAQKRLAARERRQLGMRR